MEEKTADIKIKEAFENFTNALREIVEEESYRLHQQEELLGKRMRDVAIAEQDKTAFLEEKRKLEEEKDMVEKEKTADRERKALLTKKEQMVAEQQAKLRNMLSQLE